MVERVTVEDNEYVAFTILYQQCAQESAHSHNASYRMCSGVFKPVLFMLGVTGRVKLNTRK